MQRSDEFDLGRDKIRMKDPRDAARQHATVDALLRNLFGDGGDAPRDLQIVADEVGMGKTFVALGAGYSVLAAMKRGDAPPDLKGCYQKLLIITPRNAGLFAKWSREVGEFVKRCVKPSHARDARRWFAPEVIENWDEIPRKLRKAGVGPAVLIAKTNVFDGGKVLDRALKLRFLLGLIFKHWGVKFKNEDRERLLKGAPEAWPRFEGLLDLTPEETAKIPLTADELRAGIASLDQQGDELAGLLERCREIATPYVKDRTTLFKALERKIMDVYRFATWGAIKQAIPLVIVDEAHNWKNGPSTGANGYYTFRDAIASRTRRALLLTATPFQLRPKEMLELLKVGDSLAPAPTEKESVARRARLEHHRDSVIAPALDKSVAASRAFAKAWGQIARTVTTAHIAEAWADPRVAQTREALRLAIDADGALGDHEIRQRIDEAVINLDPTVRALARQAMVLHVANAGFSRVLRPIVIRHRRLTHHRAFLVGTEYAGGVAAVADRPDRNVLHGAPGLDVTGSGELPHYLLMRCVSEMKEGQGRTSLGSALTGCYSTLFHSSEGKKIAKSFGANALGAVYLNALRETVSEADDPSHPKVARVVDAVVEAWGRGEKSLVFCFRVNTAKRLQEILNERLRLDMDARRERCLGGKGALKALKGRITGRDGDLVGLALDRVLWSLYWSTAVMADAPFDAEELLLTDGDLSVLAEVSVRFGVDVAGEKPDRVFIHRAVEHAVAVRLVRDGHAVDERWNAVLAAMVDPSWVSHPYGAEPEESMDASDVDGPALDERGVHVVYREAVARPDERAVQALASQLAERRARLDGQDRYAIVDGYARAPSLWFGPNPSDLDRDPHRQMMIRRMHGHLRELTLSEDGLDWQSRKLAFEALRRALLRDSVLLRLLPDRSDLEEAGWGDLLVQHFYAPLSGQTESMAERAAAFVEDLAASSGHIEEEGTARNDLYEATKLRDQQFVALAKGGEDPHKRTRVFSGFNTPLLPEVLVCTSVGQEGIDLHRHCRHVIHYDLAWNPAVLEQRTGRADRIGSMTFRERKAVGAGEGPYLEVGVPFLAGTYDERMYEELRLRAQTFEILTGGDLSADAPEGDDEDADAAEGTAGESRLVALSDAMVHDLRVRLHVWDGASSGSSN